MAIRTVILEPGECATIPSTATVISITADGGAQITSDCQNLPPVTGYKCYRFAWEESNSGSLGDAYIESLIIGTNTYTVPSAYNNYDNAPLLPLPGGYNTYLGAWIDSDPQFVGIVKFGCDSSSEVSIKIQVPEGLPAPQLKVVNPGPENYVHYMIAVEDNDCVNC